MTDYVNHPKHYTDTPFGMEVIEITRHYNFCIGNALKYIFRAGKKWDTIEDLKKAVWYINREITDRENENGKNKSQQTEGMAKSSKGVQSCCGIKTPRTKVESSIYNASIPSSIYTITTNEGSN